MSKKEIDDLMACLAGATAALVMLAIGVIAFSHNKPATFQQRVGAWPLPSVYCPAYRPGGFRECERILRR